MQIHTAQAEEHALENVLRVASTTSTDNSGLLNYLLPIIQKDLGFAPQFVITGTGKALSLGRNKDVDLVWVHDDTGEQAFMKQGYGIRREKIMYNRFVLVGALENPAKVRADSTILDALSTIESHGSTFISRGDDSGTHRRERALWAAIDAKHPILRQEPLGWYREVGSGMGATLNITAAMNAYTISDEATWLNFQNKQRLGLLLRDDQTLFNPYSAMVVGNTGREESTRRAHLFTNWLISSKGQTAINQYQIHGVQAFTGLVQK